MASEAQAKEEGPQGPSFLSIRGQLDSQYKAVQFLMTEQERERERLARWLRNDPEYDDWAYATEPIPGDHSWAKKKAPEGASDHDASSQSG